MFDYLRNLTKSAEEKQQEALNAYLDDALSPTERQQFEQLLASDADLRQVVEQRRALQMQMRQMPRRRVPRNFTLDPAVYGRPQRQPLFQLYPVMRVATVLTAFFFILAVGAEIFLSGQGGMAQMNGAPQDVALFEAAQEESAAETAVEAPMAAPAEAVVEVTRVVTETVVEEGEAMMAEAAPMLEAPAEEAMADSVEEAAEPAAEPPQPQAEDSAANAADPGGSADQTLAATAPLPTPSAAATIALQMTIDATKSTIPRPEAEMELEAAQRAVTAVPTNQSGTDGDAVVEATAVPVPLAERAPIGGLRWLQIGLGVLLIGLGTAVFYVRRQTF